jgi:hypothetical protein
VAYPFFAELYHLAFIVVVKKTFRFQAFFSTTVQAFTPQFRNSQNFMKSGVMRQYITQKCQINIKIDLIVAPPMGLATPKQYRIISSLSCLLSFKSDKSQSN